MSNYSDDVREDMIPGHRPVDEAWAEFVQDTDRLAEIVKEYISEMTDAELVDVFFDRIEHIIYSVFLEEQNYE